MIKAIIVEDDRRDKEVLERILKKFCSGEIEITGSAVDIDAAYQLIIMSNPDVVFLDIELGNESGFDLLRKFNEYNFKVIFVTAYDRYAIRAIKFNAIDYVLKPVDITELVNAVKKVKANERRSFDPEIKNLMKNLANPHLKSNRLAIPVLNGYKLISVESILYCEAKKEYTDIICKDQQTICSSVNLGEYEELLQDYSFCRVHHSFLVNKDHITQYIKGEGGELLMGNDTSIPVSRRRKPDVLEWLKKNV